MYSPQDQLVELVRHLETSGVTEKDSQKFVFSADPILITEKLQNEPTPPLTKLYHRATRIDADGKLARLLQTIELRIKTTIGLLTLMWFVLGFVALFTLLQADMVNFFYVLVCLLGVHTLMLVLWLGWLLFAPRNKPNFLANFISPNHLVRHKDRLTQSAVAVYEAQLQHKGMKWYISRLSHQFWLASLSGMLCALVFMLLVKNYTFVWQSTLLENSVIQQIVHWMAWLPEKVGFAVPTDSDILQAQNSQNPSSQPVAFRWGMLLIGSLLMYGIVPRAVVWLLSLLMLKTQRLPLDIKQPYYQKILDFWQRGVIDPDDSPTETKPVAPTAKVTHEKKLVALLEYAYADEFWYQFAVGHDIENFGIIDDRDDMDRLADYLQKNPVQVLLGIPPQALPDRGSMRKLDKMASLATGGLIVQLLKPTQDYLLPADEQKIIDTRKEQWETALAERNIGIVRY